MKIFLGLFAVIVLMAGCSPGSPKRSSPSETISPVQMDADLTQVDVTPKVDILVVVDNSDSMEVHQNDVAKNIKQFVSGIKRNKTVDFHIGVVPIYDSKK